MTKERIDRFVTAVNRGHVEDVLQLFAERAVLTAGPWFVTPLQERPAIRRFLSEFFYALPGISVEVKDVYSSRNAAIATVRVLATMSRINPDPVHIPDWREGRRLGWTGAFRFAFTSDGKILEMDIYGDDSNVQWLPSRGREGPSPGRASPTTEPDLAIDDSTTV